MKHCPICSKELKIKTNESIIVKYKTSNGVKDILVKNISFSYCPHCGEIFYNKKETENYEIQLEKTLDFLSNLCYNKYIKSKGEINDR